jgi:hypothetical protein
MTHEGMEVRVGRANLGDESVNIVGWQTEAVRRRDRRLLYGLGR